MDKQNLGGEEGRTDGDCGVGLLTLLGLERADLKKRRGRKTYSRNFLISLESEETGRKEGGELEMESGGYSLQKWH